MAKRKTKAEKLFDKILNDRRIRQSVVKDGLEYFFPIYFHQYMKYESAPFHKEIFDILEDVSLKLAVIVAFRGSAKSTIITTAYVLWSVLGVQEEKFIVICGQTEQKARQYLMNIKMEIQNNELLKKDLGPFEEERNDLGNATAIIIKKLGVKIMITSVGQSIRGMRHAEHRPGLIILDDIEDTNSVKTREGRDKTFNWLTGEVIPAGSQDTRVIAVGNLLHEDSVLKRLQKKIESPTNKHLNGVYREYPIKDDQDKSLWPAKFPDNDAIEAERGRIMNDISWYREYLLKIISTDEQVVNEEWLHFYDKLPVGRPRLIGIGVDLAISEKESADYTAMVIGYVYGYGKNMEIYVQPYPINERLKFPDQVDRVKTLHGIQKEKSPSVKFYIEDVGYQRALIQQLSECGKYDIIPAPTKGSDKTARLRLATPMMKDKRVFFPREGCESLIEQLLGFGKEKHDDLADAFAYLIIKTLENNQSRGSIGMGRGDLI